jgi:hypothetical protein
MRNDTKVTETPSLDADGMPGTEVIRFFAETACGMVSVRSTTQLYLKTIGRGSWKPWKRKAALSALSDEAWLQGYVDHVRGLPRWQQEITDLPTIEQIEEWAADSVCETPSGETVEHDGTGPDGSVSWLRLLGLI